MRNEERMDLNYLLMCFQDMGATEEQLAIEYQKLRSDRKYCDSWLRSTEFFGKPR